MVTPSLSKVTDLMNWYLNGQGARHMGTNVLSNVPCPYFDSWPAGLFIVIPLLPLHCPYQINAQNYKDATAAMIKCYCKHSLH